MSSLVVGSENGRERGREEERHKLMRGREEGTHHSLSSSLLGEHVSNTQSAKCKVRHISL